MAGDIKKNESAATLLDQALPGLMRFAKNLESTRLARFGLTLTQFFTMGVLDHKGDLMMRELGAELDLSMGAVTGVVDKLAKLDLVRRYTVESDRRVVKASLTRNGRELFEKVSADRRDALNEVISQVSSRDMETFLEILERLMKSLESWVGQETAWRGRCGRGTGEKER